MLCLAFTQHFPISSVKYWPSCHFYSSFSSQPRLVRVRLALAVMAQFFRDQRSTHLLPSVCHNSQELVVSKIIAEGGNGCTCSFLSDSLLPLSLLVLASEVPVVKELRYLFTRFYMFCMVPGIQDSMEGCPASQALNLALLCLTGLMTVLLFFGYVAIKGCLKSTKKAKILELRGTLHSDEKFLALQQELLVESLSNTRRRRAKPKEWSTAKSSRSSRASPLQSNEQHQHRAIDTIMEVGC